MTGLPFRETQAWRDFVYGKLTKKGKELKAPGGNWGPKELAEAWEINPHGNLEISEDSRKVKVVGVWDTVGSLGIPDVAWFDFSDYRKQYGFHNVKLNESRSAMVNLIRNRVSRNQILNMLSTHSLWTNDAKPSVQHYGTFRRA